MESETLEQRVPDRWADGPWRLPRQRAGQRARDCVVTARARVHHAATRHFKKSLGHLGSGSVELFEIITTMKTDQDARYSVVELCSALGVSRSGFYDHEQKPDCERRREDGVLRQRFQCSFWKGAVLTVGVASKRAFCAKGFSVAKS